MTLRQGEREVVELVLRKVTERDVSKDGDPVPTDLHTRAPEQHDGFEVAE